MTQTSIGYCSESKPYNATSTLVRERMTPISQNYTTGPLYSDS